MRTPRPAVAGALFLALTVTAAGQPAPRRVAAVPADAGSVDAAIAALYASVSHGPDREPDFERMRTVFLYTGMLIPPKGTSAEYVALDVDQFAERFRKGVEARKARGEATGFFEKEIARRTDCFGNVCQVFSTYESRHAEADPKAFQRGINSIQLLRDGKRWWIASVAWDAERPENPIPPEYLPSKS